MNLKQAIQILKTHNQWRRGALIEQTTPKELGIAIDIIVNIFEDKSKLPKYKVWLEDSVEPEGGFWWRCYLDNNGCLQDFDYPDENPDTLEWYIENGYKVEKNTDWIDEAWKDSKDSEDLTGAIERYHEYQSKKNV